MAPTQHELDGVQRIVHEHMKHPRTGEPLGGWRLPSGKVFYDVVGASQDDPSNNDGGDGGSGGEGGEGSGSEGRDEGSSGGDGSGGDGDKGEGGGTVSRAEFEALQRRMQAADRRASEAEKKAKEYEDKDKGELDKAKDRVTELENQTTSLTTELENLRIQNAFLSANDFSWHDPEDALTFLNKELVTVEDGKVKGMKDALKDLAKRKPHLLKKDGESDEGNGGGGGNGPSGSDVNGRKGGKGNLDEEALKKKYPALRR